MTRTPRRPIRRRCCIGRARARKPSWRIGGHVLLGHRHGLVANVCATHATGTAERDAAVVLLDASASPGSTVAADQGYDVASFVATVRGLALTPHVAQKARWSAIDAGPRGMMRAITSVNGNGSSWNRSSGG